MFVAWSSLPPKRSPVCFYRIFAPKRWLLGLSCLTLGMGHLEARIQLFSHLHFQSETRHPGMIMICPSESNLLVTKAKGPVALNPNGRISDLIHPHGKRGWVWAKFVLVWLCPAPSAHESRCGILIWKNGRGRCSLNFNEPTSLFPCYQNILMRKVYFIKSRLGSFLCLPMCWLSKAASSQGGGALQHFNC